MNISASYGGSSYYKSRMDAYLEALNNNYSRVSITTGKRLMPHQQSRYRSVVVIDPTYLDKTAGSDSAMGKLDNRLRQITQASEAFANINTAGYKVEVQGYTIDSRGKIMAYGVDRTNGTEERFELDLGRVGDDTKFKELVYDHFGVTATQLLFNSKAGLNLFA